MKLFHKNYIKSGESGRWLSNVLIVVAAADSYSFIDREMWFLAGYKISGKCSIHYKLYFIDIPCKYIATGFFYESPVLS